MLARTHLRSLSLFLIPSPIPSVVALDKPWCGLVAGIGGTGVLTVNSLLAMAAHIEGKGFATMNQTGLAQKYGSVVSHIKIARDQSDIHAVRVKDAQANLLLGCDALVASNPDTLRKLSPSCHAVVNIQTTETRDFLYTAEATTSSGKTAQLIRQLIGEHQIDALDASELAIALTGDAIAANLFLVGLASQRGLLPISPKAIERAIEVNGVAVELNQSAFTWGRRFVEQPEKILALLPKAKSSQLTSLDDIVADREARLVCYQSEGYAAFYVPRIRTAENRLNHLPDNAALLCDIARQLYRLMALKDEYEVARILTTDDEPDGIPKLKRAGVKFLLRTTTVVAMVVTSGSTEKNSDGCLGQISFEGARRTEVCQRHSHGCVRLYR